jgi:hypothetical protein
MDVDPALTALWPQDGSSGLHGPALPDMDFRNTAQTRLSRQSAQSRRKAAHWCSRRPRPGSIWSVRAAAFALCDLGGDHPPRDRLAAPQVPEPRRPDAHAEPATADPSRRYGRRVRAHRGTVATGPPDAGCQREQPGGVVLRRAAARQSGPQLGSGRSPQQHGHVRRSMTAVAGVTGRPGTTCTASGFTGQDRLPSTPLPCT